jgi:hypothetical protein
MRLKPCRRLSNIEQRVGGSWMAARLCQTLMLTPIISIETLRGAGDIQRR